MTFLGWDRPLLHSAADWLLDPGHLPAAPDFSGVLVVVPGRRAGRRLLELLALQCAEQNRILVPPEIVTPARLVMRLTEGPSDEPAAATPLASALAWAQALGEAGDPDRNRLFRRPGEEGTQPGLRALLGLGKHLGEIWAELGASGLGFREVAKLLAERFPHIADFEAPRWEVMDALHRRAAQLLRRHDLEDETTLFIHRARQGKIISDRRVILVGVVEMPRIVRDFIARLALPPDILVFAPESERDGFDERGGLHADYWNRRPAKLEAGQIHLVERDRDQALRAAHVVQAWRDDGIEPMQMIVAVPDPAALARLRESLDARGVKTRWAQGRPASEAPAFQFLLLVAEYLDRATDEPPRYETVAALARHPDLAAIGPSDWSALDRFTAFHLPARFDPAGVREDGESVWKIHEVLRAGIDLPPDEITPKAAAEWTLRFLLRIYGDREENALSPAGRVAVHAIELLRDVLADAIQGRMPWPARIRPADFLHVVLGFLGDQPVPEPPDPGAVELVGWLEVLEDDAPALVVASFYEGAVPKSISADPFLPGSLRQALGLGDNAARLARDGYALAAMAASRAQGRGGVALLAPRFDAAENPVRPSRLLLNGLQGDVLARRIWHLAGKRPSEPHPPLQDGPGFHAVAVAHHPPPGKIRVTAFRDYIESPRKFYFLHVLRFQAETDDILELHGGHLGTLIHQVLEAFGEEASLRDSSDPAAIESFLFARFDEIVRSRFGPWAQAAVELQVAELRYRLRGFARVQAALRREGWSIRYVEGSHGLACDLAGLDSSGSLTMTGRIDRIDSDASGQKWRIIDYKTSPRKLDPLQAHYRMRKGEWTDLQLPLYLKLAAPYARAEWNVELTPENCELAYFQLPDDEAAAELSAPFPPERIEAAWAKAAEVATQILRGNFEANPLLNPDWNEPALLALCGQAGISSSASGVPAGEGAKTGAFA